MNIVHNTYLTRLGTPFRFAFVPANGGFDIHIVEQPAYGDRSDDVHATHRITTDSGFKICWTGKLESLSEAKRVAAMWSHATENYILTGNPFPTP